MVSLEDIQIPTLETLSERAVRALVLMEVQEKRESEVLAEVSSLENQEETLMLVSELFRKLIDQEIMEGVKGVEDLQTEGLRAVFYDQVLSVKAEVKEERGKISVHLITVDDSGDEAIEGSSVDSFGGSVMTMEEIFLRVAVTFQRGLRPILLLDETLGAVSNKYADKAVEFLRLLAERMGMDILLISHDESMVNGAHHAYRVTKSGNKAVFRKQKSREE